MCVQHNNACTCSPCTPSSPLWYTSGAALAAALVAALVAGARAALVAVHVHAARAVLPAHDLALLRAAGAVPQPVLVAALHVLVVAQHAVAVLHVLVVAQHAVAALHVPGAQHALDEWV